MADPLDRARELAAARQSAGVNLAAGGAEPSTTALRAGRSVDVGAIVLDRKTGLHGVIRHVSTQTLYGPPTTR